MRLKTQEQKIRYRIRKSSEKVFLLDDFNDICGKDQSGRILRFMVRGGELVKIGQGLYSKAVFSKLLNKPIPVGSLPDRAREALKKLGVETAPTKYEVLYNEGLSTQVPVGNVIGVRNSRVVRRISFEGWNILYEPVS